ncbi:CLUMA_CG009507, isoform A [Clunio marinus]|uniref:CLUMA_CG009507, isoform A n=1 Tax=Clunio marinus TaxID=568069 RepID=A0A1J1I6Y9_9DIPT|nr:CLUMA_CG009507, isoform A [Clunio marinus]
MQALKFICFAFLVVNTTQGHRNSVPVLIWGQHKLIPFPALYHMTAEDFSDLFEPRCKNFLTIVFIEEFLKVEDLSQCKIHGKTCFQNLSKMQNKVYLTSVEDPVKVLEKVFMNHSQIVMSFNEDCLIQEIGQEKDFIFVYFDKVKGNEDFIDHDETMAEFFNLMTSKRDKVVAIYTGKYSHLVEVSREKRQVFKETPFIDDAIKNPPTLKPNEQPVENPLEKPFENPNVKGLPEFPVEFEDEHDVNDPPETKVNQHPRENPLGEEHDMNDTPDIDDTPGTEEKVPPKKNPSKSSPIIMTTPILTGLLVFIFFSMTVAFGLSMILSIKSNDRFDNPKGPTINVAIDQ